MIFLLVCLLEFVSMFNILMGGTEQNWFVRLGFFVWNNGQGPCLRSEFLVGWDFVLFVCWVLFLWFRMNSFIQSWNFQTYFRQRHLFL